ncbi:MAG: M23 family metallopeptidase [Treponema sp.]|jgi:murein DD-endopeptidase MepM/ murein hydrolase activator NlpD|nr:M23 family metallopeptidase [Treponema sp.]
MNHRRGFFRLSLFLLVCSVTAFPVILTAEDAVHVVKKGETVYSISRSYRIAPEELMKYNNIVDASKLQTGSRLKIPESAGTRGNAGSSPAGSSTGTANSGAAESFVEYQVVKNDTLYGLARKNNISQEALERANNFSEGYVLKEGERIRIPQPPQALTRNSASSAPPEGRPGPAEVRPTVSKGVDPSIRWPVVPRESAYMTGKLYGVMLTGARSEPVKSLIGGTVISAGPYRGFGRVAIVQVTGGYLYVYGGCESLSVKEGDRIGPGAELGKLGIDAVSQKPQLFFLVYKSNSPIDPAKAPRA